MNMGLKLQLVAKNIRISEVATNIGISKSSFYRKLCGKNTFNADEILRIARVLKLSDQEILSIFFAKQVS